MTVQSEPSAADVCQNLETETETVTFQSEQLPERSTNNPFQSETNTSPAYKPSTIDNLESYPFKTLNRIIDDLRWSIPFIKRFGTRLLTAKPIDYSNDLAKVTMNAPFVWNVLTLNNSLEYAQSTETVEIPNSSYSMTIVRGLLTSFYMVNHFRFIILRNTANPFTPKVVDKHEYHLIHKSLLSQDDLSSLQVGPEDLIDDAFFKSKSDNHILRVSIFKQEFTGNDLSSLVDSEKIKLRYTESLSKYPELSPDTVPNLVFVLKKLIQVLKGPILLKPNDHLKTINLSNTFLDSHIDLDLLYNKLGFSLNTDGNDIVPPNLNLLPQLKEEYKRRIIELIYLAKTYGKDIENNEFLTKYSFADNASLIFRTIPEADKHNSQINFISTSTQSPILTNLSISPFFQDDFVIRCFENTIRSDPKNKLHYVDSLKNCPNYLSNSGNRLASYIRNLSSKGELIGFHDLANALRNIGLTMQDYNDTFSIDDDIVIAMYNESCKKDPKNYTYFNKQLQIIGKAKNSPNLHEFIVTEIVPLDIALDELNIEEITEDDVVITAYEFKLDDVLQTNGFNADGDEINLLHKSLLSVAINRKSYLLLNYIETKIPTVLAIDSVNFTVSKAYEILNSNVMNSDFDLITNFQSKLMDCGTVRGDNDIRVLRACLKIVAESRKSEILIGFLKTGKLDSSLLPAENWPAGLDNIGNTCYLNSLLQYYFCIKPLRDLILTFDEREINIDHLHGDRKIGGRKVEDLEIQRSNQFIYHLRYLFYEMIHTDSRCVQPSKALAYLAFLPLSQKVTFLSQSQVKPPFDGNDLEDTEVIEIEDAENFINDIDNPILVTSPKSDPMELEYNNTVEQLDPVILVSEKSIFTDSSKTSVIDDTEMEIIEPTPDECDPQSESQSIPVLLPISTDQIESTIEVGRQQDVTECIENVTYQIETALEPEKVDEDGEQYDLIKKLFYGKIKQTITPIENTKKKPRISFERFFSLIINVSDNPKNIYDSLDNYFSEDLVKLEEGDCKKSLTIADLPEVLQFHVQRVMFDRERLMPYKSLQPIPFSEKIYLDRYLETDDPEILNKRNEVFMWKSEIQQLNEKKNKILQQDKESKLNVLDSLEATKKFLESKINPHETLCIKHSTIEVIQNEIDELKFELQSIESRLLELHNMVSKQFSSYTKVGYSIFAIFIHRGEASYGHYWVYIKDPHRNVFRKYNDELVTEVPLTEVFNFNEGNTATPYYIVYVKNTLEMDYVDPLKRIIDTK
jgi:ubiquitin carboxyl-terminal hydrolase 25/28